MSRPPRGRDNAPGSNQYQQEDYNGFSAVLNRVREINDKTDLTRDELSKTRDDIAHLSKSISAFFKARKDEENRLTRDGSLRSSGKNGGELSQIYDHVYKGTYQGIIDGLAKSKEQENLKKAEIERARVSREFSKSTAKNIIAFPGQFRRGLINLFAFERSEILQTYRAIRHSVGIDKNGNVDYQSRLFRLMLEDRSKKGTKFSPDKLANAQLEKQVAIIDILSDIRNAAYMEQKRAYMFRWMDKVVGKKEDLTEIKLLQHIDENTKNVEKNTDTSNKRGLLLNQYTAKIMPAITSIPGLLATSLAPLSGVGAILGGFFAGNFLKKWIQGGRKHEVQQTLYLEKISKANESKDRNSGFFGFGKKVENQSDILKDIRTAVSPKAQEKTGLAKMWYNFTKVPISDFFKKQQKFQKTDAEKTVELLEQVRDELEDNVDWTQRIYGLLRAGVGVFPAHVDLTPFEEANLSDLEKIEDANLKEIDAIMSLRDSICKCLTSGSADDYVMASRNKIGAEERERENVINLVSIRDSVSGIYDIMLKQANGPDVPASSSSISPAAGLLGAVTGGLDKADGIAGAIQTAQSIRNVIRGKRGTIVSLSDYTMKRLKKIIDDDNPLDVFDRRGKGKGRGKGGRRRRGRLPELPSPKRKPGLLKRAGGLGKKLLGRTGGMASRALPLLEMAGSTLTGGMGLSGLLSASGGAIASAGAGAMAGAAGLVAAAGAAGYGVGTLLNKGLNAGITKLTGGDAKTLGDWIYNMTHKKEIEAEKKAQAELKAAQEKRLAEQKKQEEKIQKAVNTTTPQKTDNLKTATASATATAANAVKDATNAISSQVGGSAIIAAVKESGNDIKNAISGVDGKTAGELSKEVIEKAYGVGVATNNALVAIYDKSENSRMELMAEMKNAMEILGKSETVKAIQESVSEVSNYVSGATTNITMPVSAYDNDRSTNLLSNAYSS